ncbi:MAG: GNAT family N-acetyltransferase [Chthonomonas sp.]|nr:GNAT family N-acetyltransferase [Chthonomonas sp.]
MFDLRSQVVSSDSEIEQYKRCYEEVWRQGKPFEPGEIDPNDSALRYLALLGTEVVGSYKVHRYRITRFGDELECAGVASVGVVPHHRSSGIGAEMMRLSLHEMRDQGFAIAALYPFRGKYYRQFGYEFCGSRWQIKCPVPRLPKFTAQLPARRIAVEDVVQLDHCYKDFIKGYNGANVRTEDQWRLRMGKGSPLIYVVGDPIEAYAWTSMDGGFWEELNVGEIAWSSPRGYESIMAVLRGLAINRSHLVWSEPTQGPYITRYLDQGADVELHRPAMYRILDGLKCGLNGAEVQDPDISENNRIFGSPAVSGSVGSVTQAFLGEPSVESLVTSGALCAQDIAAAKAAFPSNPVLCTEFF